VELLLSEDPQTIRQCTEEIEAYNAERRLLDEQTTSEALALLDEKEFQNSHVNLVYKEGWSKGVVGIVASRIIEQRFKPTIVLSCENEILTGSARTTNDFDIHHALVQCEDLFLKFGGHTHAAGLSLMKKDFPEFRKRLNQWILENISQKDQSPVLLIDQVIRFSDLFHKGESIQNIPRLKRILDQMEPHGPGNLKPIFVSEELYATKVQVLKEKHLKISVCQADFRGDLPAIGFNMADKVDLIASGLPFSMAYTLETNTWNNKSTLQLNIKDIQEATIFSK
jgi:single-stranded-DNA-specific exonuclease